MFNELLKRDALNTRNVIFTKIELPDYDIVVPFICRKCGICCMTYIPRISTEDLITIVRNLKWSPENMINRHTDAYLKRLRGKPETCIFLNDQRLCMIYSHPLRPDVCRLYPFSFGGTDTDCDAYLEHKRVVETLLANEKSFEIYDASFCPNRDVRPIPDSKWPEIYQKLRLSNALSDMIKSFLILNGASLISHSHGLLSVRSI
ncbi:MAG TPA: YkgJ family cysteine cluster protein [Syntrophales bacterium]|nr:YkgJ family cysteine cluster protein [Syntrophales bacterium]